MLKRPVWLGALAALAVGCSGPSDSSSSGSSPEGGKSLEVMAFKGGYGIDMYEQYAQEFAKEKGGVKVAVSGNPRVWEQIRPRMVGGNPPDLMFPGWGMDHWALVEDGQLRELDTALDGPAHDGKGTWRETFDPKLLKLGQRDGKTYMLPYYVMVWGWWYDPGVFKKHGWTPPKTYAELLALAPKIKAAGMAPLTFQGQYPYYMVEGFLLPWAASAGGVKVLNDAQNLVPGAWSSPAMLEAAKRIDELNRLGYFMEGAVGMSHTEAQTQFLNGKAAMVPCGSWIPSEMQEVMPKGVKLEFLSPPTLGNDKNKLVIVGVEPWMVPTDAKNPDDAIALFKYMTALPKAKEFVQKKATLMAIRGSDEIELPEVLVKQAEAVKGATDLFSNQYRFWYPAMEKEIEGAMTSLLNKEISPQQFVERCEAAAEKTRKDDSIKKYKAE